MKDKHSVVRIHLCGNYNDTSSSSSSSSSSSLPSSGVLIVVVTRSGLVSVWDPSQFTVKAFGKSRIPLLLYRYCLWDCENYVIKGREDFVIGVESITSCQEKLLVTLRSTFCLEIDILHRECRILSYEGVVIERNRVGEDQTMQTADNIKSSFIPTPASVLVSLGASQVRLFYYVFTEADFLNFNVLSYYIISFSCTVLANSKQTVVAVSQNSPNTIFFCNEVAHRPDSAAQTAVLRHRASGNGMLLTLPGR
jgi:hypothetical protein